MAVGTWMTGLDVQIVQEWKIKLLNWKHHERPFIAEHAIVSFDSLELELESGLGWIEEGWMDLPTHLYRLNTTSLLYTPAHSILAAQVSRASRTISHFLLLFPSLSFAFPFPSPFPFFA